MELNERLYALTERIKQLFSQIKTEEATKQSFILPFFQLLGYDVFNPLEFCPEFVADVGIKKGEKVDYVILTDGKPFILIEAKACFEKLEKHDSQLFRYFGTTESKFAILTNGIIYRFFTDLEKPNKMDSSPFFELNMLELNDQSIQYLENFVKSNLNVDNIMNSATELKYLNLTKSFFKELLDNPTDEFVRHIMSNFYEGTKTQAVIDKFRPIIKKGINQYINDRMSAKFKETLSNSELEEIMIVEETTQEESRIVTTEDELFAYSIIKSILRNTVSVKRIFYKDTESYFGIMLDNNIRKWICRINIKAKGMILFLPGEDKSSIRYNLNDLDDLYEYSAQIEEAVKRYL